MGSIHDIGYKIGPERKRHLIAIDIPRFLVIDEKQVVALLLDCNIDVLAHLDVAVGPKDEEPPIAPRSQSVGSEPVQAHVTESAIVAQHHVTEVLEARIIGMPDVRNLRLDYFGAFGASVVEELVYLVRANVAQDAAILVGVPEPVGP